MKGYKFLRLGVHSCRDYQATLEVVCEKGSRDNYGLLNWTVAQETDDLVYYHSYTHENFGWKIRVLSPGENGSPYTRSLHSLLLAFLLTTLTAAEILL